MKQYDYPQNENDRLYFMQRRFTSVNSHIILSEQELVLRMNLVNKEHRNRGVPEACVWESIAWFANYYAKEKQHSN